MCVDLYVCVRVLARALRGVVLLLTTLSTTFIQKGVLLYFFFSLLCPTRYSALGAELKDAGHTRFSFTDLSYYTQTYQKKKKTHHHARREKKKSRATKLSDTADFDTGSGRNTSYIFSSNSVILRLAYYIYFGLLCESLSLCVEDFSCNDSALKALQ